MKDDSSSALGPKTRWAILGTGQIAHAVQDDLRRAENVSVEAVYSRDSRRARWFASQFEVPRAYSSLSQVLADENIDVVYVCSPHSVHAQQVSAAIRAGKHVLCEKPLSTDAASARALTEQAGARGVFLLEAMWTGFVPAVRAVIEELGRGTIGETRHVEAGFGFPSPYDPTHRLWNPSLGGGAIFDLGVYPLSLSHLLMGAPEQVHAIGKTRGGVDGWAVMTMSYKNGAASAVATCSLEHFVSPTATVSGTSGYIEMSPPFWRSGGFQIYSALAGVPQTVTLPTTGDGYYHMFVEASRAVLHGDTEHPWWRHRDTVAVHDVMDRARASVT